MRVFDAVHWVRIVKVKELKIKPKYFQAQKEGRKNFEICKNDRDFQEGEVLILREYDSTTGEYSGRRVVCLITYITDFEQKPGYVVLGTKRI